MDHLVGFLLGAVIATVVVTVIFVSALQKWIKDGDLTCSNTMRRQCPGICKDSRWP